MQRDGRGVEDGGRVRRRRAAVAVAGALGLVGVAGLAAALVWANTYPRGPLFDPIAQLPDPLPAADAERNARRISVAFADAQAFWARAPAGPGRPAPARLVLFTRSTATPCAPGATTAGPFYCAERGSAAFDLLFFEALGRRMRRDADLGTALVVGRVVGAHVQAQAPDGTVADGRGAALVADCLAGVWAGARRGRVAEVPPGFYGRLIQTARNTAGDLARTGPAIRVGLDPFRPGRIADREAAFQAGYTTGEPALCSVAGTLSAAR